MKKKLKLYLWENVLVDYTPGVMFAIAETAEEARKLIGGDSPLPSVKKDLQREPKIIEGEYGFYLYGGG